jgi:uncharacterized protein
MSEAHFTPLSALGGGILIGLGAALLLIVNGRIAGISGILSSFRLPERGEVSWRGLFLLGLLVAGATAALFVPASLGTSPRSLSVLAAAGLLVGAGTRMGNGCTSGHGVCGISRGSLRSVVATCTFVITGVITVTLVRVLGGGG